MEVKATILLRLMSRFLCVLGPSLLFAACHCDAPTTAAAPPPPAPVQATAVLRFPCDDKAASAPCDEVAFRAKVLASPFGEGDLFQHQQGGPRGAVWNAEAPLYLFVKGEGLVQLGTRTLSGGTVEGGWRWFRVPYEVWSSGLSGSAELPYQRLRVHVGGKALGELWAASGE